MATPIRTWIAPASGMLTVALAALAVIPAPSVAQRPSDRASGADSVGPGTVTAPGLVGAAGLRPIEAIAAPVRPIAPLPARGGRASGRDAVGRAERQAARPAWRLLRVAKWSTLAAAVGGGAYGLREQHEANRTHDRLERICADEPARCNGATVPDGDYTDPGLERMHRRADIRADRAVLAMIASQAALASSIALFVLDMRESALPPNEPYQPAEFRLVPGRGGGAMLRVRIEPPW